MRNRGNFSIEISQIYLAEGMAYYHGTRCDAFISVFNRLSEDRLELGVLESLQLEGRCETGYLFLQCGRLLVCEPVTRSRLNPRHGFCGGLTQHFDALTSSIYNALSLTKLGKMGIRPIMIYNIEVAIYALFGIDIIYFTL